MTGLFSALSKVSILLLGVFSVIIIGLLDYFTGVELSFSIFYFLPLVLVSWFVNKRAGIIFSILCACSWGLAEFIGARAYSTDLILIFNTLVRLCIFLVVSILISKLRSDSEALAHNRLISEKSYEVIQTSRKLTTAVAVSITTHNTDLWMWIVEQKKLGAKVPEIVETTCRKISSNLAALTEICFTMQPYDEKSITSDDVITAYNERIELVSENIKNIESQIETIPHTRVTGDQQTLS